MARLAYLGTPELAVPPLRALAGAGHDIALCVTRPDRKRGRGAALSPSPVKAAALELGIPVTHAMADVAGAQVELGVVVAFGRIIPAELLAQVPMVNLHFSLLPRWRGAAPVERALLAGDEQTGVCLMRVDEGLDTGPVYAVRRVPIGTDSTLAELRAELVTVGADMLVDGLRNGVAGLPEPVPQQGEATFAEKIDKGEHQLHWSQPALVLHRVIRLGQAWTTFRGRRLRVLRAAVADAASGETGGTGGTGDTGDTGHEHSHDTVHPAPGALSGVMVTTGDGTLRLLSVQPESRSPMSAEEWVRGIHLEAGERLGSD